MFTMFRLLLIILLPATLAFGQESPSPSPTPSVPLDAIPEAEATPVPESIPVPSPAPETTTETDAAVPAAVPAADASPSPEPSPEATPEVSPEAIPETTPDATPDASVEATPLSESMVGVEPSAPGEDVIPLPSEALPMAGEGAPLDTQPIVPDEPTSDEAFIDPNSIVPDMPPSMPAAVENEAEKQRAISIRYTEVRTQVEKDPEVESLNQQAEKAKTDEGRRAARREYYRLLFKKMVAIDKSLEKKCKDMEAAYIRRLAQSRLEPTIPLNPPPTPEPIN